MPVIQNGERKGIWMTELEKVLGLKPHYTDVNLEKTRRLKLLSKAWCVRTIKAIFTPLLEVYKKIWNCFIQYIKILFLIDIKRSQFLSCEFHWISYNTTFTCIQYIYKYILQDTKNFFIFSYLFGLKFLHIGPKVCLKLVNRISLFHTSKFSFHRPKNFFEWTCASASPNFHYE